jgi:hypothetical protein
MSRAWRKISSARSAISSGSPSGHPARGARLITRRRSRTRSNLFGRHDEGSLAIFGGSLQLDTRRLSNDLDAILSFADRVDAFTEIR